jgi:hypothetical protein
MTDFSPYQRKRNPDAAITCRVYYELQTKVKGQWQRLLRDNDLNTLRDRAGELTETLLRSRGYRLVRVTEKTRPLKTISLQAWLSGADDALSNLQPNSDYAHPVTRDGDADLEKSSPPAPTDQP